MPTLKTYTTTLGASGQSRNTGHNAGRHHPKQSIFLRHPVKSASAAELGPEAGWTRSHINRVRFEASPGDFPRGRPALNLPSWSNVPGVVEELTPQCSSKGCRASASWQLRWNNPKLHTPDYRKTWLACDDHRESLSRFLEIRGFLRAVEPFPAASSSPIS